MSGKPNFLIILADDLGYTDVGCYGSEIETPNIDRLAENGMVFTDFHSAAACSPTRAMLLTGTDNHLSGMGIMAEGRSTSEDKWYAPGYEGYMNYNVAALPEILQDNGYHTILSGKWHLGFKPECGPKARGFDKSLALLPGQTNHWAFHPELDEPNAFFARMPILHTEDGKRKVFPTNVDNDYDKGFYSSDCYARTLIRYFEERTDQKPFFAYLPFAAPHWPIQCSKADREKYKGMYDGGPAVLREKRLQGLREKGLLDPKVIPHEVITESFPGKPSVEWEEMTSEQRAKSARAMETYAGMVEAMDRAIGLVLDHLDKTGELDNTLVAFMSDNGSEGAAIEAWPVLGTDILRIARLYFNNSLENIGNHDSFVWYGPRWAQASTAPSRLYKMYSTEGGIRVPLVLQLPKHMRDIKGKVDGFSTIMDFAPTILEMADIAHPVAPGERSGVFRGRKVIGMRGKSWMKALHDGDPSSMDMFHPESSYVGWELHGKAALRQGRWKILYLPANAFGKDRWELYDIQSDPGERIDLADTHPDKVKDLQKLWDQYVRDTGTVWRNMSTPNGAPEVSGRVLTPFGAVPEDTIGGDPVAQCTAWMDVGDGQVAQETPPLYNSA